MYLWYYVTVSLQRFLERINRQQMKVRLDVIAAHNDKQHGYQHKQKRWVKQRRYKSTSLHCPATQSPCPWHRSVHCWPTYRLDTAHALDVVHCVCRSRNLVALDLTQQPSYYDRLYWRNQFAPSVPQVARWRKSMLSYVHYVTTVYSKWTKYTNIIISLLFQYWLGDRKSNFVLWNITLQRHGASLGFRMSTGHSAVMLCGSK